MGEGAVHGIRPFRHWRSSLAALFLVNLCITAFVSLRLLNSNPITGICSSKSTLGGIIFPKYPPGSRKKFHTKGNEVEYALNCSPANSSPTCPTNFFPSKFLAQEQDEGYKEPMQPEPSCPEYFRWIHEDLMPWRETGITLDMVQMAARNRKNAHFRLVIVNGTPYVETYSHLQHRDVFTLWGILQLLRRYAGKIPDLDLIFYCGDCPSIAKEFYPKPKAMAPPPLFGYDGDDFTLDIAFPDWSFWGWPEINAHPWDSLSKELKEGNERSQWVDREPYAFWKGNPKMTESRRDLLRCNVSPKQDWNARVYSQDWIRETKQGFKTSKLADQCKHRYKIYIEGKGWSVSQKYILACDSVTLLVNPRYYEFYSRSLIPLQHYWPIRADDKCRSIKYAVDWGNSHQEEAQAIGKAASSFIQEELEMKYIYDYMLHLLTAYAKLLRYKPTVPPNAIQLCPESLVCQAEGLVKQYMMDSAVNASSDTAPCAMPPPYDPVTLLSILERKENSIKQVETWEKEYWDAQNTSKLI